MTSQPNQRVLLAWSLSELEARRQLKEKEAEGTENNCQLDNNTMTRRVYLSKIERDHASQLPQFVLKKYFKAGEFVHVPMTREERFIIEQFNRFNNKRKGTPMDEDVLQYLTE